MQFMLVLEENSAVEQKAGGLMGPLSKKRAPGAALRLASTAAELTTGVFHIFAEQDAIRAHPHAHAGAGHPDRAPGQGTDERPAPHEDRAPGGGPARPPAAPSLAPARSGGLPGPNAFAEDLSNAGAKGFRPLRNFRV